MTQDALFLLAVAVVAGYMVRLALRLAPPVSEFPLKTILASLLSAIVALAELLPYRVGGGLQTFVLVAGPLYAFGPLLSVALARVRRYRMAAWLVSLLYWTQEGRSAVRRLPAQVALQRGDVDAALELIPEDDKIMLAQAYALRGEWQRITELELPATGDKAFLGDAVRIEALLRLGRQGQAQDALDGMRARWEQGPQGPLGYRSVRLSEARIAAESGDLSTLRDILGQPLPGVPAHVLLALLAGAAERAGRRDDAGDLYGQAYAAAPESLRGRYAERLQELGSDVPASAGPGRAATATYALAGGLALAFLAQLWLDATVGPFAAVGSGFKASSLAGGFLLGLPGLPEADAWWRYLSYTLVHGHLLHIGFNIWVLIEIGRAYEQRKGRENLLASFVLGSVTGALITAIAHDGGPLVLVGASGGVLGVAGALLADALSNRSASDRALTGSLLRWMGLIVILSLAIPNVSLWGHVGGVVGGMLWGFLHQGMPRLRALDALAGAASLAFLLVALAHAATLALRLAAL
ncbi:MAG: rhomboid family intramembrane serine protease [Trueperaceae bacterium]